jgi:two-component system sensor histidine kinase UhpB
MNLTYRMVLRVSILSLVLLVLAMIVVVHNNRQTVLAEIRSSVRFVQQIVQTHFHAESNRNFAELAQQLEDELSIFNKVHNAEVTLYRAGTEPRVLSRTTSRQGHVSPRWFLNLIGTTPIEHRSTFKGPDGVAFDMVIRSYPGAEIDQAWGDVWGLFNLLLLFALLLNAMVLEVLRPMDLVLTALDKIEHGNYRVRLPLFHLSEWRRVASKFNHMAGVMWHSSELNKALTRRSLTIQEQERRNLAQELHDELGQSMSAIRALSVAIQRSGIDAIDQIHKSAKRITDVGGGLYDAARQMMRRLRPVVLDELGLVAATAEVVSDWNENHPERNCRFVHHGDFGNLDDQVKINLYRIVQESLTNVAKYAGPCTTEIRLTRLNGTISDIGQEQTDLSSVELVISDDGVGFDPATTTWSLGLSGIRERTEAVRGVWKL